MRLSWSLVLVVAISLFATFDLLYATESDVRGLWSTRADQCKEGPSGLENLTVTEKEIRGREWGCEFFGGLKESSAKWVMRGKCCGEGECANWDSLPQTQIDLRLEGGVLKLHVAGDSEPTYYAVKCGDLAATRAVSPRTYWFHNGSMLYLVAIGRRREFLYQTPRPAMLEVGATTDSILFEGEVEGERYVGQAYIFNRRCGKVAYHVEGPILEGGRKVILNGQAPRVDETCRRTGAVQDRLVFELVPWQ